MFQDVIKERERKEMDNLFEKFRANETQIKIINHERSCGYLVLTLK